MNIEYQDPDPDPDQDQDMDQDQDLISFLIDRQSHDCNPDLWRISPASESPGSLSEMSKNSNVYGK